jgi:hypothetical protein
MAPPPPASAGMVLLKNLLRLIFGVLPRWWTEDGSCAAWRVGKTRKLYMIRARSRFTITLAQALVSLAPLRRQT